MQNFGHADDKLPVEDLRARFCDSIGHPLNRRDFPVQIAIGILAYYSNQDRVNSRVLNGGSAQNAAKGIQLIIVMTGMT